LPNLHKIGKYSEEIGEKSTKLSTKSGKIGTVLTLHPPLVFCVISIAQSSFFCVLENIFV